MADRPGGGGRVAVLVAACALLAGCTGSPDPAPPGPSTQVAQAGPPAPPAACLLDTSALAAATGLTWTPDETTATDTRCVYDPTGAPGTANGIDFLAVDLAPAGTDAATELDTIAQLCDAGSRAPVSAGDGGFVCRFQGGSVFAALVRGGQVVTVASSAVPAGTTAARMVVAVSEQLAVLGR